MLLPNGLDLFARAENLLSEGKRIGGFGGSGG